MRFARHPAVRAVMSSCLALGAAACGPAPYLIEEPAAPAAVAEAEPARPRPDRDDAEPGRVARREPPDRWIPEVYPRPNPFVGRPTWVGHYDCPQGRTDVTLHVTDARGTWVRAVFDFHHAASGAAGQFYVAGAFDEGSGRVVLQPGPWIHQPADYVTVGLDGNVSRDGKVFAGKITNPDCGAFRVHPAR